jgi:alkanesulfonate monooxygenase SsuD/methylene tetrahydromethanopterin reductase-like flavin-dependent oxidoreductase (luciferase family)
MKFHWFAEATYPHLPDDFPDRGVSSWVTAPTSFAEPQKLGEMYRMFIRLMQQADRDGFDGLAVNEHHQTPFACTPSPNLLAASLAGTTENAAILIIGDSLALYNPPTRVAEEMGYLDCLSGGRLIAGFVFGTPMDSVFAYGNPPVELRERFHEARELILKAWKTPEPFAFNGKYSQLRYVNVWPRPVQNPPPIWVPGSGSVETWDLVIDQNYCYGHLSFSGLHSAKPTVDAYWEYVAERGGDDNPNRMAFTQIVCCAETDAEAEAKYYDAVRYFYRMNTLSPGFMAPPGYTSVRSAQAMAKRMRGPGGLSPEDRMRAAKGEMSFWEYDEKGYIIAGTPERVRQRIEALAKDLRIGQLIACAHMGDLSEEQAAENTYLFGTRVIPGLRHVWADYPDHWTPKVSQQRVAAAEAARRPARAAATAKEPAQ